MTRATKSTPTPRRRPRAQRAQPRSAPRHSPRRAQPQPLVTLPADCLLPVILPLRAQLSACLASPEAVTLDVGALQRIDTACMQLLAAFACDRARSGRPFQCRGSSAAWHEAVRLLGLGPLLPQAA